MKFILITGLSAFALGASMTAQAQVTTVNRAISEPEVQAAQQAWCKALVDISAAHTNSGQAAAKALAEKVIDAAYGYQMGAVLFKPTLTVNPQTFRTTRAGALSYFVGGDPTFPKDTGFALKGWNKCEVANAGIFIAGDSATTLGMLGSANWDASKEFSCMERGLQSGLTFMRRGRGTPDHEII